MAANKQPTPKDRSDAIGIALAGLASGEPADEMLSKLSARRIRHNTLPAEELLELASEAIDVSSATPATPSTARGSGNGSYPNTTSLERHSTTRASTSSLPPP